MDFKAQLALLSNITTPRETKEKPRSVVHRTKTRSTARTMILKYLEPVDRIGSLGRDDHVHVLNMAEWTNTDILVHIANNMPGRLQLHMAVYSLESHGLDRLFPLCDDGKFESVSILMDPKYRVQAHKPIHRLATCDLGLTVHLTNLHSKVFLVTNGDLYFVVESSGNMISPPMVEAFIIKENRELFDFHLSWITRETAVSFPYQIGG